MDGVLNYMKFLLLIPLLIIVGLFIEQLFFTTSTCNEQWTVVDRFITADRSGSPTYYTTFRSPDGYLDDDTNPSNYYKYAIGDQVYYCTTTGNFTGWKTYSLKPGG